MMGMTLPLAELLSEAELRAVIARFYESVVRDDLLAPLFVDVDRATQEERLYRFIRMTSGRPTDKLDGIYLRDVHRSLRLSDAHFERRRALVTAAVRACGHGEEVVVAWAEYDALFRAWVLGS